MTTALAKSKPASTATRHLYDVIVLGPQLGATLAGALLAKRGYRVLHVDPDGLGAHYEDKGYALPWAPAVLPSLKLMPAAEAALQEIGIAVDVHRAMETSGGDLQLLFPKHRLDFAADAARRATELTREFGADQAKLTQALNSASGRAESTDAFFRAPPPLPPEGFFERWALKKAADACPGVRSEAEELAELDAHELGPALRALSRFLVYLDDEETSALGRTRPLAQLLKGAHRFPGGALGLREALRKRLGELGGELVGGEKDAALVEELTFEGSKVTGVKLASSGTAYRAHCVIAGLDAAAVGRLIPPKVKKRKLAELFDSVRTRRYLFSVNLVVREEGLPPGLGDLSLILPGDPELGPVLVEVLPATKAGGGHAVQKGEKVVCAGAFVPASEREAGEERQRELAKRIEAQLYEVAPFLDGHVLARSAPFLDAKSARTSRLMPHPLLQIEQKRFLGVTGLPQHTACKNLFLATREVVPGLGIEGEMVAGARVANIVGEQLKKHDPLK